MDEVSRLTLAVDSSQVRKASGDLDTLATKGKKADDAAQGMASSFGYLKGAIGGLTLGIAVRATLQAADSYANLNARLQLATKGTGDFTKAQSELFAIAQRTRTALDGTVDLFGSLSRSTQALGVSQQAVLGVTETINQALAVSGTSAQGAAAALVQLGQGFASGVLRGEELNSVLEQAPRLAKALADGLGVPVGKLRELGAAGELTADKVFAALQKSGAGIKAEFDSLPETVGAATTKAGNAVLKLIGTMDQLTGASAKMAGFLSGQAGGIAALAEEFRLAKVEGQGFLEVMGRIFKFFAPGLLGGGPTSVEDRLASLRDRLTELGSLLDTPRRLSLFSGQATSLEAEREQITKTIAALDALDTSVNDAETMRLLRQQRVPQVAPKPAKKGKIDIPYAIRDSASEMRQRFLQSEKAVYAQVAEDEKKAVEDLTDALEREADVRIRVSEIAQRADDLAASQAQAIYDQNEALRAEVELIGKSADARSALNDERLRGLIAAKEEELILARNADASAAQIGGLEREIELLKQRRELLGQKGLAEGQAEDAKKAADAARDLGMTFSSAFEDAIVSGNKLSDVLKGLAQDLLRLLTRQMITKPLASYITGMFSGAGGAGNAGAGDLMAFMSEGFAAYPRAAGGPVQAGRPYLVGERGPEFIVPKAAGTVLPNGVMPAAQSSTYQVVVQGDASENTIRLIRGAMAQFEARMMMRGA